MRTTTNLIAIAICLSLSVSAVAQCDTIASICEKHITTTYIPDFDLTLFGGTTYRVAACSGTSDGNLVFSVYDKDRNVLYSNKEFNNDPYWDLVVSNTIDVTIEAQLDQTKASSGCAVMLIGFKK
jgi:hypothetical protein